MGGSSAVNCFQRKYLSCKGTYSFMTAVSYNINILQLCYKAYLTLQTTKQTVINIHGVYLSYISWENIFNNGPTTC
jgi:hypothetical protein